jgi:C_GCAxxG_C_C family probable redox protein
LGELIVSQKQEQAVAVFGGGFNCAQAVIAVFCEKYGLARETALKITCGMGGGFRSGEICGAASGAVLVIGLKYGQYIAGDKDAKKNCYAKTKEFLKAFKEKNTSIVCREILKCNVGTKEGHEQAASNNLFKTTCVDMIKSAVEILEEQGY